MKWIKIDNNNLPDLEVLCANFCKGTYGYKEKLIGYTYNSKTDANICCENEGTVLENCTHYIDMNKFDIK